MKVNEFQPDPIQNRSLSDSCWNGKHFGQTIMVKDSDGVKRQYNIGCNGWNDECEGCTKSKCMGRGLCNCLCHNECECRCHSEVKYRPKISRQEQANATMDIMESGCGTIEVK